MLKGILNLAKSPAFCHNQWLGDSQKSLPLATPSTCLLMSSHFFYMWLWPVCAKQLRLLKKVTPASGTQTQGITLSDESKSNTRQTSWEAEVPVPLCFIFHCFRTECIYSLTLGGHHIAVERRQWYVCNLRDNEHSNTISAEFLRVEQELKSNAPMQRTWVCWMMSMVYTFLNRNWVHLK